MSDEPPALPPPDEPAPPAPEQRAQRRLLPWLTAAGFVILAAAIAWVWKHPAVQPVSTEATDTLGHEISALEARVTRLEQRPEPQVPDLGPLTARLTELEQRPVPQPPPAAPPPDFRPLEARVAALERRQPADLQPLENRTAALEAKQQQITTDLSGRIASLENSENALRADLSHQADVAASVARHTALVQSAALALAAGQKLGELPGAPPALARFANAEPPTLASLRLGFPAAAHDALGVSRPATEGKPLMTRLWAQAQDLVTIRQGDKVLVGDPAAGALERARDALNAGDLNAAVAEVGSLQGAAAQAMAGWLAQARALLSEGRACRVGCVGLMRRILLVLLVAVVVLVLAWGLASLPGRVSGDIGDISFEAPVSVAALGVLLLFAVLFGVLRLLGAMVRLPRTIHDRQARRRRASGDVAVTHTLLALAAGDTGDARREANRARRLLGDTPATLLLAAEAGRLAGRADEAEAAFRTLADRDDAAFLGLRGLLRQAIERADWTAAMALARQAEAVQPGAAWLRRERARLAVRAGEWSDALALADADVSKAALATAAAEATEDAAQALRLARRAWNEDPSLAPATLAYAKRLRAAGREARALTVIRHGWSIAPQPELAAFALAPVTDPLTRTQAAQRLTEANPTHAESRLVLARTALEAGLTGEARRHAEAAVEAGVNQRQFWLLLAEIADLEGGDQREALRRAATADPDPVWRCEACHTAHADWQPACPDCFTVGSLRWSAAPVEGPPTLQGRDETFLISSG